MKPLRAWSMIREQPVYRREAFASGLQAAGYEVHQASPWTNPVRAGEVLVIWNRYDYTHQVASRFEKAGGIVLVAENGYLGVDRSDRRIYAIARHAHNGRGQWPRGDGERFARLGIEPRPWRAQGGHILVAPNRSFGMPGGIMDHDWAAQIARALQARTRRPVRVRMHPGNVAPQRPLAEDLRDCWAVVIWSSSVGVEALVAGVPVVCCAPWWICKPAAAGPEALQDIEQLPGAVQQAARLPALQALAWAQWSVDEIADGTAFRHLLRPGAEAQIAAGA